MAIVFFVREDSPKNGDKYGWDLKVTRPEDLRPVIEWLADEQQEHVLAITLDGANQVIASRIVTIGLLNHSLLHPREIFAPAITDRAASVILVHNHPSGSMEPSSQDKAITKQIKDAGEILGIRLLDHLILAGDMIVSLRERGDL